MWWTKHILLSLVLISLSLETRAIAEDDRPATGGSSWSSRNGQWTRSSFYSNIRNFAVRPEGMEDLKFRLTWQPPQFDRLGNLFTVSGQLKVMQGEKIHPVDWFQGITVYMGVAAAEPADWSAGITEDNALEATTILDHDGSFSAEFNVREAGYDRKHGGQFQFGVALAQHKPGTGDTQQVIWSSKIPIQQQSIQMLQVPIAPELPEQVVLIDDACAWPDTSAARLIRAVNALQKSGKKQALRHLQQYSDLTESSSYYEDREIIFWIIHLLFEPSRLGDRIPVAGLLAVLHLRQRTGH